MPDPTTIIVSTKNLFLSLAVLFATNVFGWKLFAKNKLDQMKDHEDRIRNIEENYPRIKYMNQLASSINDKLDSLNQDQEQQSKRIDEIYNILLSKK